MGNTQSSTDSAVAAADRGFDRALGSAAAGYRLLGWSVAATEQGIFLDLGPTAIALAMPGKAGARVLADLKARMLAGPTLVLPGPRERWVFLAELVALLPTQLQAPADVQLVRPPHRVALPPTLGQPADRGAALAPAFHRGARAGQGGGFGGRLTGPAATGAEPSQRRAGIGGTRPTVRTVGRYRNGRPW